jgi:hypothetical protein
VKKKAKTREEISFAIGFLSHVILDKEVHTYIEKELDSNEHLLLEFFVDSRYAYEKYPLGKFQRSLFNKTIKKKHNNYTSDIKHINWMHLQLYKLNFFLYKSLIMAHFIKARVKWYHRLFAILPANKKWHGTMIKNILLGKIDKAKVKIIEERIDKAKKIFEREIETYFKRKRSSS